MVNVEGMLLYIYKYIYIILKYILFICHAFVQITPSLCKSKLQIYIFNNNNNNNIFKNIIIIIKLLLLFIFMHYY